MAIFRRNLNQSIIEGLKDSDLWNKQLKKDCENQKVFLAIRDNNIGFYHKGGRLFGFDKKNRFDTNIKYAAIITINKNSDYLFEDELKNITPIDNFHDATNYKRIKDNCQLYSKGTESEGVSKIYHKHSYLSNNTDIVVLDIEVSFEALDKKDGSRQDRIDILLFNKHTKTLKFVEAKLFSNKDIKSSTTPNVIEQIRKYEKQIKNKEKDILQAYKNYVATINEIFKDMIPRPLPIPEEIDKTVSLLIFNYDENQEKGTLEIIKSKIRDNNIVVKSIGDTSNMNENSLNFF